MIWVKRGHASGRNQRLFSDISALACIKDNYKNLQFAQPIFPSGNMMFRKVKQAPMYVEQTHPTDCLWIYMKAVYTQHYTYIYTYIHIDIHLYTHTHDVRQQ